MKAYIVKFNKKITGLSNGKPVSIPKGRYPILVANGGGICDKKLIPNIRKLVATKRISIVQKISLDELIHINRMKQFNDNNGSFPIYTSEFISKKELEIRRAWEDRNIARAIALEKGTL